VEPGVRSAISALDRLAVAIGQMKQEVQGSGSSLYAE
jgi:hypothetical protein